MNKKSTHSLRIKIKSILNGTSSFKISTYQEEVLSHKEISSINIKLQTSLKNDTPGIFFYRLLNTYESIIHLLTCQEAFLQMEKI